MPQIKAVFFDLDDTLLLTTQADELALQDVRALLAEAEPHLDWAAVHVAWKAAFKETPWDPTHKVLVEEWRGRLWQEALRRQGVEDEGLGSRLQACFTTSRVSRFAFEPRVEELVRTVKEAHGLKVVIITNGHAEVQRSKLKACKAEAAVPHILVGGEEIAAGRHEKPAASIFLRACELAGCQPHEAVHVGDSLAADIQGAINAGLGATIWCNTLDLPLPPNGPQPTYTVKHVTELLRCLAELQNK